MKFDEINNWLTLAANIGVIAGIVFLAYELRQNNENLEAQARNTIKENRSLMNRAIAHDPAFAQILLKARSGGELTPVEQIQLDSWFRSNLANWEWDYEEFKRGRLDINLNSYKTFASAFPQIENLWDSTRASYSLSFQEFMDTEILTD